MKRMVTVLMTTMMLTGACQPPNTPAAAVTDGSVGHPCDRGRDLSADDARPWEAKWSKIEAARASGGVGEGTESCALAKEFVATCPRWSPQINEVYASACAAKRREVVAAKEEPGKPGCPAAWMTTSTAGKIVREEMDRKMRRDPRLDLASAKDPNDARRVINEVKYIDMKNYRCDDEDAAKEFEPIVEKWAADTEAAIDEEIKCRASEECRARRIANQICATMIDKKEAQQQIATERANPGGVVSLRTLHDLGERVQYDDASISSLKRDYASLAKKPFTEAACSR